MTELTPKSGNSGRSGGIDSEIDVRQIAVISAWLAAITVGALVIGYFIYKSLGSWSARADPAPSPLVEAGLPVEPPSPRLQISPEKELQALRAGTSERLSSWGWVDRGAGVAHMPIDQAIDRLAQPEPPGNTTPLEKEPATPLPSELANEQSAPASGH